MLPTLDARLTAAAELVRPGRAGGRHRLRPRQADGGTGCFGPVPQGHRGRPAPRPAVQSPSRRWNMPDCQDRAELRLGDGLSVLSAGEVGSIVLAGVSAQTTWEILEKAPWVFTVGGPRIIMIPATRHSELRRWLWDPWLCFCGRPPRAGGRPLVCRDGSRVHRGACTRPPFPSVCWAAPAAGRRAKATPPGRRPSSPACALVCRTAPRWQTRSTDF